MNDTDMTPDDLLQPVLGKIQQDSEQALIGLDDLIQIYGNDARLHFLRGSVLAGLEHYGQARTAMQTAVDMAPDYALARFQLGLLELSSGDPVAAQSTWGPLSALPLDNPLRLFAEGLRKLITGAYAEAIALLEEGIALNTELPPMNRDMILMIQQMREKLDAEAAVGNVESDTHFLLRQYSFKDTKH